MTGVRTAVAEDRDLDSTVALLAPRVLRYALARAGDASVAEDVAQESLEALVRHWRRSGPPESAEAFVFAIARRRAVRAVIRRKLWVPIDHVLGRRDGTPSPEAQAVLRIEHGRVRAALARLPRLEREALLLVALGELGGTEAAAVLGISVSALKMRVHRAASAWQPRSRTVMRSEPEETVDERLREAFEVDESAAGRVARRALTPEPVRATRATLRASLTFAALALCAGLVWLTGPTPVAPGGTPGQPAPDELSASFVAGSLILEIPGDGIVIAGPERRDDRPPDGQGIVIVEGELQ